jgi:hypothetical protein
MASYMTASEAFAREKLGPNVEVSTSQTAWADKYRGVRRSSKTVRICKKHLDLTNLCYRLRLKI